MAPMEAQRVYRRGGEQQAYSGGKQASAQAVLVEEELKAWDERQVEQLRA